MDNEKLSRKRPKKKQLDKSMPIVTAPLSLTTVTKNKDAQKRRKKKRQTKEESITYKKRKAAYLKEKKRRQIQKKRLKRIFESLLVTLGAFILLFILFRLRIHRVSGTSMIPTLNDKEIVLTEKTKTIQRGELILFKLAGEKETYVKRVIGMPGDAIWLVENTLYINPYIKTATVVSTSENKLPNGTTSIELKMEELKGIQGFSRIPADCYFVLGDNAEHSIDSRTFGFVTKKMVEGKVY
ncbi:signal peptidase I [Enterococcus sp. AZ194]|uniref:signal peptidase I n=1 Tax=Enterococcus sp. AZ194 TaxID=2774629 RepID=UPI003F28D755